MLGLYEEHPLDLYRSVSTDYMLEMTAERRVRP